MYILKKGAWVGGDDPKPNIFPPHQKNFLVSPPKKCSFFLFPAMHRIQKPATEQRIGKSQAVNETHINKYHRIAAYDGVDGLRWSSSAGDLGKTSSFGWDPKNEKNLGHLAERSEFLNKCPH